MTIHRGGTTGSSWVGTTSRPCTSPPAARTFRLARGGLQVSLLSRHLTVPTQRAAERVPELGAPAPPAVPLSPASDNHRVALLIAGGVVIVAAGVGGTTYFVNEDGTAPAAPSTTVEVPSTSEAKRDAAAAARHNSSTTEGKRDAAMARRNATR